MNQKAPDESRSPSAWSRTIVTLTGLFALAFGGAHFLVTGAFASVCQSDLTEELAPRQSTSQVDLRATYVERLAKLEDTVSSAHRERIRNRIRDSLKQDAAARMNWAPLQALPLWSKMTFLMNAGVILSAILGLGGLLLTFRRRWGWRLCLVAVLGLLIWAFGMASALHQHLPLFWQACWADFQISFVALQDSLSGLAVAEWDRPQLPGDWPGAAYLGLVSFLIFALVPFSLSLFLMLPVTRRGLTAVHSSGGMGES